MVKRKIHFRHFPIVNVFSHLVTVCLFVCLCVSCLLTRGTEKNEKLTQNDHDESIILTENRTYLSRISSKLTHTKTSCSQR